MKRVVAIFIVALTAPLLAGDPTIPVLDLHDYHRVETHQQFVAELSEACQEVGCFALINTGIDLEVLDHGYEAIAQFFALDHETKMRYCDRSIGGQRGYSPGESAKGEDRWDVKEFYHVGRAYSDEPVFENIWPTEMDLEGPFMRLFGEMERCIAPLQEALSLAMGQPAGFVSQLTGKGETLVRALRYPPNPPAGAIWDGEHTDISYFTVIPRTTARGLQVLNTRGEWITVIVPNDAFIFNVGDKLQNMTNGLFRSGVFRVVDLGQNTEPYSMPFYVHPQMLDDMSPLPACVAMTGGVQRYPNATSLELLEERLAELRLISPSMLEHLAKSGFLERTIALGIESPEAMQAVAEAGLASPLVLEMLG